ncbi:MAG TPA: porphobilinogen synthase [Actinomycetospora sp.]|nr:porphobilinogen synthase [Actinomycetospora sp.]
MFPTDRPRRLRATPGLRRLVAETDVRPRHLVLPVFVAEGLDAPKPITSMPGVVQHTRDSLRKAAAEAAAAGVGGIMLFGVPARRDAVGSGATDPDGILNVALRDVRAEVGDALPVMADTCLDEFTDHGHCGVLDERGRDAKRSGAGPVEIVDNDATLPIYGEMAVAQAEAGAHVVAPSGMMDGQVGVIRRALDEAGHRDTAILAYSAKYASAFYGPFREAVDSQLQGDRRTYQQDPGNAREAAREVALDLDEGADMVMVKPAMSYLDVLRRVADSADVPVAAYQVSGEYAMISAAAERGWLDRERTILESLTAIRRAGADVVLTYWAAEATAWLDR